MDYIEQPASYYGGRSSRNHSNNVVSVKSGKTLCKLIGVSIGLLCILQAALNISLRLVYSQTRNNLHEEIGNWKTALLHICQTSPPEARGNDLTEKIESLTSSLLHINLQDWVYFQGSFYYISNIKKSWQDSRDDCLRRGADLVIINSKEEQDFTRNIFDFRWIGLNDTDGRRTWTWVDGTPLSQSYWRSGEPNNNGFASEDCVQLRYHDEENSWNDEPCGRKHPWICEKKVSL